MGLRWLELMSLNPEEPLTEATMPGFCGCGCDGCCGCGCVVVGWPETELAELWLPLPRLELAVASGEEEEKSPLWTRCNKGGQ